MLLLCSHVSWHTLQNISMQTVIYNIKMHVHSYHLMSTHLQAISSHSMPSCHLFIFIYARIASIKLLWWCLKCVVLFRFFLSLSFWFNNSRKREGHIMQCHSKWWSLTRQAQIKCFSKPVSDWNMKHCKNFKDFIYAHTHKKNLNILDTARD